MHGKNEGKGKNANSMDAGENWGRASAAESAAASSADGGSRNFSGLCSLGKQPQRPAPAPEGAVVTDRDDHGDSSSEVSVCPETVGEVFRVQARHRGRPCKRTRPRQEKAGGGDRGGHAGEHGHARGRSAQGTFVSRWRHRQRSRDQVEQVRAPDDVPRFVPQRTQQSTEAGASICAVAVPTSSTAKSAAAVQGAALQGSAAASSSSSASGHALEGMPGWFSTANPAAVRPDVDDDEEDMDMDGEDAIVPKGRKTLSTHFSFRSCCPHCVRSRAPADPHRRTGEPPGANRTEIFCVHLKGKPKKTARLILQARQTPSK